DFIAHLGGGHDHIYPLLQALSHHKRIIVLNIDAHADTRLDSSPHSGTPFRQFASIYAGDFHLYQLGLHAWANSESTLSDLPKGKEYIFWSDDLGKEGVIAGIFENLRKDIDENTVVVFSLDADALSGYEIPGVSAVNGKGLNVSILERLWRNYQKLPLAH